MFVWVITSIIAFILLYFSSWFQDVKLLNRPFDRKSALLFASLLCIGGVFTILAVMMTFTLLGIIVLLMKLKK